ncbi:MAG: hypothetical protein B7Y26_13215 [Hydrogenophilales bacterium 16-64-46]|nr:MAG: hypothetical protein B7Z32_12765 [Hydrogenophilales bacterium 12-64-13]OYZ04087.1 MAG: hypothetical protein B7Y26_13215 [Hydrogenophilales bacterium 16-64-46]OZA36836.1 MAG: hypothetical protein B7X87_12770 [Hydrogenophilales bacterium 17-64-34]HQT00052.1 trypsin-like peptidase domain-containing protein [Thiobacillus sp.]
MTSRLLLFALLALSACAAQADQAWKTHVARVVVERNDGMRETGSAVALAGDRLVTNCHVIEHAARIEIELGERTLYAKADAGDRYRDLCFLRADGLDASPVPSITIGDTRVGLDVVAAGFPGGRYTLNPGRIVGLHTCECDGGKVIQTSAPFDRGASGGGLFDAHGRLVGILTFKSRGGGNFHFALPLGWLRHLASQPLDSITGESSFWASAGKESGYFLAACGLGERQAWRELAALTEEWREREPYNPEAWMATGRAYQGLGRADDALTAYRHVLQLDSTHGEAQWAVQQIELLGDTPGQPGGG